MQTPRPTALLRAIDALFALWLNIAFFRIEHEQPWWLTAPVGYTVIALVARLLREL